MNFHPKALVALLALALLALSSQYAAAQTVTWGGLNGSWNVPANWTSGTAPGSGTDAIIDSGTANLPVSVIGTSNGLTIGDSGTGSIVISGGTLTDTSAVLGNTTGAGGTAIVSGGIWNNSVSIDVGNSGSGVLGLSGGAITTGSLYLGETGTGVLNMTGGTITGSYTYIGDGTNSYGAATISGGYMDY